MHIFKRMTMVATVMAIGLLAALPAAAAGTFTDDDGNVHEANIEAIAAAGITLGCNPPDNTLYCPSEVVTRGAMAAFLVRALELPAAAMDHFTDDAGSVFEADINSLAEAEITLGCNPPDNSLYCPDDPVTRGQMAAFLVRGYGYTEDDDGDRFSDDDTSVFEADIEKLATAGITLGCNPPTNDRFCPDDPVLRDQMASFLARAENLDPIPPTTTTTVDGSTTTSDGSTTTTTGESTTTTVAGVTFDVQVGNGAPGPNVFVPDTLPIAVGDEVRWTNVAGGFHDVTWDDATPGSGAASSLAWEYERTFADVGTFGYTCSIHGSAGMTGTVTVTG